MTPLSQFKLQALQLVHHAPEIYQDTILPSRQRMNISHSASAEVSSATPSSVVSRHFPSSEIGDSDFAVVPPIHTARTLVYCFNDATTGLGSKYRSRPSNSSKFFNLLDRHNEDQQKCARFRSWEEASEEYLTDCHDCDDRTTVIADKDFAIHLDIYVRGTYRALLYHYRPGNKISFFGFSHGAYVARALAEMIHKVGLLPVEKVDSIPWAYSLYLRDVDDRWHELYERFREKCNPIRIEIDFVGVWDTLSSVGDVLPYTLPFTRSNTSIRVFRQALALHERWAHLHPKFYEFDAQKAQDRTDVQEMWFAGSHCDVGGCAVPEDAPHSLGRISLRWMVRECFRANTGIQFRAEALRSIGLDLASLYPTVKERPTPLQPHHRHFITIAPPVPTASEEEHDVRDTLAHMHDQLAVYSPLWWAMELSPMRRRIPIGPPSEWNEDSGRMIRMSQPRGLFTPKDHSRFYIHPTVYTRMQAKHKTYTQSTSMMYSAI